MERLWFENRQNLLNNIERFAPIDGSNKSNSKSYRLSKNGKDNGVLNPKEGNNNHIRIQIQYNRNGNNQSQ